MMKSAQNVVPRNKPSKVYDMPGSRAVDDIREIKEILSEILKEKLSLGQLKDETEKVLQGQLKEETGKVSQGQLKDETEKVSKGQQNGEKENLSQEQSDEERITTTSNK